MEQFRRIGEVWGSVKALMVLRDDIRINKRQCCLLLDVFRLAYKTIAEEIKNNLRLEEKNTKWKALEQPLKELHRIFKDCDFYIRNCLDYKDWWGKAISLHQNKDCVEFHIHNLLSCFPVVIEAIETAEEISGLDQDEMMKRKFMLEKKYEKEWSDPRLFLWKLGKQYLVCREICSRLDSAWREDRWLLLEAISERRSSGSGSLAKHEKRLGDLLSKKMSGLEPLKLFPISILVGAKDYHVKRRLGGGNQYKEIQWLGESFALRHIFGEIEPLSSEIFSLLSLSHPNILQFLCGFCDEGKKECFLVMELVNKDLSSHITEHCCPKRRIPFSLPVVVDLMLQIARGMEYLHSRKIYHGDLNPSNILLKARNSSSEGYFHAKVSGFGLPSIKNNTHRNSPKQNETRTNPFIWHAPEVLAEQEQPGKPTGTAKYTEKADVYSYGMLCFELLTGKVPFEDGHLKGDKMCRNIRAGGRPLFPVPSPKFLVSLTRKCWQTDPIQRPSFSSVCRILRYIKKFIVMNPGHGQIIAPSPLVDYCDIEAGFLNKFSGEGSPELPPVSQIPYQMFAYRLLEKEKTRVNAKNNSWDSSNELASICRDDLVRAATVCGDDIARADTVCGDDNVRAATVCGDDNVSVVDGSFLPAGDGMSVCSEIPVRKLLKITKATDDKPRKGSGTPKVKMPKASLLNPCRNLRLDPKKQATLVMSPGRRRRCGHVSDSEIF